ncbi:MAG: DUF4097 domain-containing protein [Oscillospiraceae bacterium]|nr:DUF4097 domain-containing protein [Oscillospiraceae bacterium]
MKKLFFTSIIFCLISFTLFEISSGISGVRHRSSNTYYYETSYDSSTIFSGDYANSGRWTILNKFSDININSAGIDTIITRGESSDIKVRLDNPAGKEIHVEAVYDHNALTIEARKTNITFLPNVTFGLVSWLDDIITGESSKPVVIIEFPEVKYDSLNIQHASGSMKVHELYANQNRIHIGSGSFEFLRRSEGFVSEYFDVTLGSGSTVISGMQTESYNIDIGSGTFNINDLSGTGVINMGSGSGSVAYKEYNRDCTVDMGSGSLKLYVPEDSSMVISADIGSGSVNVDACGISSKLNSNNDDESVVIGSGEHSLFVDMGSGRVSVFDRSAYSEPVIKDIVIPADEASSSSIRNVDGIDSVTIVDGTMQSGIGSAEIIPPIILGGSGSPEFSSTFIDSAITSGTGAEML